MELVDSETVKVLSKRDSKGKSIVCNERAAVALKNHSVAEKRRRERINGHLDALRGLVRSSEKMDKATLLAEVINLVKDIQKQARQESKGLLMPSDADELTVEPLTDETIHGVIAFKASLCCEFRPDLFLDLKHAIGSLKLKILHSDISTLGDRVKTVFTLVGPNNTDNILKAIHQTLSSVINKPSILPDYSPCTILSHKRFKILVEDYSPRSVLSHKRFKYCSFESSN